MSGWSARFICLCLQVAGLLANLSENIDNQISIVEVCALPYHVTSHCVILCCAATTVMRVRVLLRVCAHACVCAVVFVFIAVSCCMRARVQDGMVPALVTLGAVPNDEVQQDVARCLANLGANEENHVPLYHVWLR